MGWQPSTFSFVATGSVEKHITVYNNLNFGNYHIEQEAQTFDVKHSSQKVYLKPSRTPVLQRSSTKSFTCMAYKRRKQNQFELNKQ